jgi:hypothetical protein
MKQRMDIKKNSFVKRAIQFCNKLPMNNLRTFPSKPSYFRKRVNTVASEVNMKYGEN